MNEKDLKTLDISWGTILKLAVAFLGFYILYLIRDVLVLVVFSLVISVLFDPAVKLLQKVRVPRLLSVSLVFVFIFGFLGFTVYLLSLTFISEVRQFTEVFSQYFERISLPLRDLGVVAFDSFEAFVNVLEGGLKGASENVLSALFVVFGGVFAGLFIFFLAFFFSLEEKWMEKAVKLFFPKKYENLALNIWNKSQKKIAGWFGVRILVSIFVGLATFLILKIFKVDYPISLSLFAGITNIIPFLGPILAGTAITVLVALEDWLKALFVLVIFILIQQIEGNILSPILMKKIIGLPPALVLISFVIGAKLFGFLGMVLAIPLAGILFDFLTEFLSKRKTEKLEAS